MQLYRLFLWNFDPYSADSYGQRSLEHACSLQLSGLGAVNILFTWRSFSGEKYGTNGRYPMCAAGGIYLVTMGFGSGRVER